MSDIFTVGYSAFSINQFIEILHEYKINCVVDVRSDPFSNFYLEYNKPNLLDTLAKKNILYRHYRNEFGARQTDLRFYKEDYLDFNLFVKSQSFLSGVDKVLNGIKLGYNFAFLCAEKAPDTCHRCIMVAREFYKLGYTLKNITEDGNYLTQGDIERILVDFYFPNRNQLSFFNESTDMSQLIKQAYDFRNKEIGYRLTDIE